MVNNSYRANVMGVDVIFSRPVFIRVSVKYRSHCGSTPHNVAVIV